METPIMPENATTATKTNQTLKGKVVVQILPSLGKGGVETSVLKLAQGVIRAGGRVVVISNGGEQVSTLLRMGGEHINLAVNTHSIMRLPFTRHRLKSILRGVGADVVHIHSRCPAWIALPVARRLNIRAVTTLHGRLRHTNPLKKFYNSIMTKGDSVIAVSQYNRRMALGLFPSVADRLCTIYSGINLEVFSPRKVSSRRVADIASRLNIPDDMPVIMLPARPTNLKGADMLIDAVSRLKHKDCVTVLVGAADGTPKYQNKLIRQIDALGLNSTVRLCPTVSDMPAALMLADVVVMPSTSPEPFGLVAIEAAAMGCPVVAFNHGGVVETITQGVTGWLAEPLNPQALAECIDEALALTQAQRITLAQQAQDFIAKNFSMEKMCRETNRLYKRLIKG